MKWETPTLPQLLLALPLAHVIVSSLFMLSYSTGFGAHVNYFMSPSDVFSVGISDVSYIYATSFFIPAALTLWRHSSGSPYAANFVDAAPDLEERSKRQNTLNIQRRILFILLSVVSILSTAEVVNSWYLGNPIPFHLISIPGIAFVLILLWKIDHRFKLGHVRVEIASLFLVLLISTVSTGLTKGQEERHFSYKYVRARYPNCAELAVVRKFSSYYLVSLPGGEQALADDKCEVRFRLPAPQGAHTFADRWLERANLSSRLH